MKYSLPLAAACWSLLICTTPAATTRYVYANGTNPVPPYISWATAATNIQDAINVTGYGDTVLVTNGIYQYGGLSNSGSNRVYASNSQIIQSVNGPAVTIIKGYQVPGTTNGANAVRCVFLQKGTTLSGFTLTNGATQQFGQGGGLYCTATSCLVTNCVIINNAAYDNGGGAWSGTLVNCRLIGNAATTLNTSDGGGADGSTLINCLLTCNFSGYVGGAAAFCTLINCTVVSNSAAAYSGSLLACTVLNSIVYYNFSYYTNDDVDSSQYFTNCCVSFPTNGGGIFGANNFTNPPLFVNPAAGDFHLSLGSPCINAGDNSLVANNTDLDGNPRIVGGIVDLGAYENQNTNPAHYVMLTSTNPVTPYTNWLTAATNIQDAIDAASAGDFVVVSNGTYQTGGRVVFGTMTNRVVLDKAVTVQSLNGPAATIISGLLGTGIYPSSGIRCAYLTNGAALIGFTLTNGATRGGGTDLIKEQSGAAVWCEAISATLSNCVLTHSYANEYGGGAYSGTLNNCVVFNNTAFIDGGGTYLANLNSCVVSSNRLVQGFGGGGAAYGTLNNCVLTWNYAPSGGGAWYSTLNNCVVSNNTAGYGGGVALGVANNSLISSNYARLSGSGGGAYSNVLNNCILQFNFAANGGGAYNSALINCTVVSNIASFLAGAPHGGGVFGGSSTNCIIYYNSATVGSNYYFPGNMAMSYCCTLPTPTNGVGNITNEPAFVNLAGGDFHLQAGSPCINAGNNAAVAGATDFDGLPRISGGTVDPGAYEFQNPASVISYAWLLQYGLPTDGSADFLDSDGDGMSNYAEWRTGTNPNDPTSYLHLTAAVPNGAFGVTVTWQSVSGVVYFIQRGTDLGAQPVFTTIQTGIVGQPGTTSYTDTTTNNGNACFYRVGVQ